MATKKGLGAKGLGIEALIHNKMEDSNISPQLPKSNRKSSANIRHR